LSATLARAYAFAYVSATDSEAGLQGTGQLAITSYVSGTATNGPIGIAFDHLSVVAPN